MLQVVSLNLQAAWRPGHPLGAALSPLGWLYRLLLACRRGAYAVGLRSAARVDAPVIVVGNLTVGGAGKTPLVAWLAQYLKARGRRPAILSRGYGGAPGRQVRWVDAAADPARVGDEPVLLARRTACPVLTSPRRADAARAALRRGDCDILLCDDGLQHAALARDVEIVVVDGRRRFGNGRCLPAGPLREPLSRLRSVDLVVARGAAAAGEFLMEYRALPVRSLDEREERPLASFRGRAAHAVAGIGHPEQFFAMLRQNGITITEHAFPDHHRFRRSDLEFGDAAAVLMTEKDAVKCRRYPLRNAWYVPIEAALPGAFERRLAQLLERARRG